MPQVERYRAKLRAATDVERFLKRHSGLPGPRGNLELAHAFAAEAAPAEIRRLARLEAAEAPENTPEVFLAFCGVLGLGRLVAEGDAAAGAAIRRRASDPRWRVREAAATALQLVGDRDPRRFRRLVAALARGTALEQRAAAAALAEPRLLTSASTPAALALLDAITRSLAEAPRPLGDGERILRQALAYAWSVVVAADPATGKPAMEMWLRSGDPDIRWAMRENLGKKRLQKVDAAWCAAWAARLGGGTSRQARR